MTRILAVALLLAPAPERTCNIPVFRYALEHWPAAAYDVVAVHRGPLSDAQATALNVLRQSGANLEVDRLDLDQPVPARRKPLLEKLKPDVPCLLALYPGSETAAWTGPLNSEAAARLVDSPARRTVTRLLLEGRSGVWIVLESGDRARDDAAAGLLEKELRRLEESLTLPALHPDDPPLRSDLPVKIGFSILRVSRTDPAELPFVSTLLNSDRGLAGPVTFPVFGRGRALWAMAGDGLNASHIAEAGVFLTGACSCEAKEFNPGFDLLFAADWEAGFSPESQGERLPLPLLKPRPPEPAPVAGPNSESNVLLWIALLLSGILVAVTGRRVLAPRDLVKSA
jgi:hypothetical protein